MSRVEGKAALSWTWFAPNMTLGLHRMCISPSPSPNGHHPTYMVLVKSVSHFKSIKFLVPASVHYSRRNYMDGPSTSAGGLALRAVPVRIPSPECGVQNLLASMQNSSPTWKAN